MPGPLPNNVPNPLVDELERLRAIIEEKGAFSTEAFEFGITLTDLGQVGIDQESLELFRTQPGLLDEMIEAFNDDDLVDG